MTYDRGDGVALQKALVVISMLIFVVLIVKVPVALSWGPGPNYRNYSVRVTVNVTEAYPEIINITCSPSPITLTAGGTRNVLCTVQIRDFNGGSTINGTNGSKVNSTFYYILNTSSQPDHNMTHYTNTSCNYNTSAGFYVNWTCAFDVWYFASNGTWYINATVLDTNNQRNLTASGVRNTTIQPLYALNVTDVIDYGELFVDQTSTNPIEANVTNLGNMNINVSVYGFGGDNATLGAGYAMLCEQRNLTLANQRFAVASNIAFNAMVPITSSPVQFVNLTIPKQTADAVYMVNGTYWRLYINVTENPFGQCNGTVVFSAEAS